jgi:hypothetical protein
MDDLNIEKVAIVEADRQMILLSLALCTLLRPGFYYSCGNIADQFQGREMFERFRELNTDIVKPTRSAKRRN